MTGWLECACGNIASILEDKSYDDTVMWYKRAIEVKKTLRSYYLKLALYYLYNPFHAAKAYNALEVLEVMELEANEIHDSYKEIDGAHSWYADEVFGLALCWATRYEEALARFNKALEELDRLAQGTDKYTNRIEAYERITGYKQFAENKLQTIKEQN